MHITVLQQYLSAEIHAGNGGNFCQPYPIAVPEQYAEKEQLGMQTAFAVSFLDYCRQWGLCFHERLSFSLRFSSLLERNIHSQHPGYYSIRWNAELTGITIADVFLAISGILEHHDVQNLGDRAIIPWVTPS